jgi:hypothetical protein
MSPGSDLKFIYERPDLSPEVADALNSFATENVPPRSATHAPISRDTPFIIDRAPMPLAPLRPAGGRAPLVLTLFALFGTAAWGAYVYQSSRPLDLDIISAWVARLTGPTGTVTTAAATAPSEARRNDPAETDPLHASNESAVSPDADRTAAAGSNASDAHMTDITRPAAAAPQTTGTSGSLAGPIQNIQNVSGEWRLDTQTEAGDSSLEGLKLHYAMKLTQDGDRVAGVGTKISENENGTGPGAQTPVTMTGTIAGDRLTLNFVEHSSQAKTRGKIVLLIDAARTLRGRFSSNATPSSGHVEGHRLSPAQ